MKIALAAFREHSVCVELCSRPEVQTLGRTQNSETQLSLVRRVMELAPVFHVSLNSDCHACWSQLFDGIYTVAEVKCTSC